MTTPPTIFSNEYWARVEQQEKLMRRAMSVHVLFSKDGWKQLSHTKRMPGATCAKATTIKREVAFYIASHEAQGIHFDTVFTELDFGNGITLCLRKEGGFWLITDVICDSADSEPVTAYEPMFIWKALKRGCDIVIAHMLVCWRKLRDHNRLTKPDYSKSTAS